MENAQETRVIFVLCLLCPCVLGGIFDNPMVQTEATNEDVVRKLDLMDKGMRDMVSSVIQQVLPIAVRSSSEIEISPECQGSLMKMVIDLKDMKEWSLKMLDATGKIPVGLMSGNAAEWGHYDQCLDVANYDETTKILLLQGQYCIVEFRPPLPPKPKDLRFFQNIKPFDNYTSDNYAMNELVKKAHITYVAGFLMAVCVPSTCSKNDIQNLSTYVAGKLQLYADVVNCEVKKQLVIDTLQFTLIGIFSTFIILCLLGTAIDILQNRINSSNEYQHLSTFGRIVKAFSMKNNIQILLKTESSGNSDLQCIHGLRFFSILWVIVGHTYVFSVIMRNKNVIVGEVWLKELSTQLIMGGVVSMETFFCIGGLVSSYSTVNAYDKRTYYRSIPLTVFRRIFRLLPGILMIIAFAIVMPIIGSGPTWNLVMEKMANNCRTMWFYNALFINNYIDPLDTCWAHMWYIAVDTQYFILALVSLSIFFRKSIWALGVGIVMLTGSIIVTAVLTYWKDLVPTNSAATISIEQQLEFNKYIYWMPYSHLSAYVVGFMTGILISKRRNVKINIVWQIVCWTLSTSLALVIIFAPYEWIKGQTPTLWESILYSGFHRPLWALSISWIIFACVNGYGGVVNSILAFKGWVPLSRLTFLVYLLHLLVMVYYYCSMRDGLFYSHIALVWIFFGTSAATYLAAFLVHIFYDAPVTNLGRILISKLTPSKRENTTSSLPKEIFVHSDKHMEDIIHNGHNGTNGVYIQQLPLRN